MNFKKIIITNKAIPVLTHNESPNPKVHVTIYIK